MTSHEFARDRMDELLEIENTRPLTATEDKEFKALFALYFYDFEWKHR